MGSNEIEMRSAFIIKLHAMQHLVIVFVDRTLAAAFGHGAGADPRPSIEELASMAVKVDLYMKQPD